MNPKDRQWVRAVADPEMYRDALWHVLVDGSTKCGRQAVMPALSERDLGDGRRCPECLK